MPNETAQTTATPPSQESNGSKSVPKARVHTTRILPSDRHSFDHHFEILKRFVLRSRNGQEGVGADKVEGEGVPTQAASMNVRFLRDVGLLNVTERAQYVPTAPAIKFVNARSVDDNRAKPILRELVAKTWFAELAQEYLRLDPVMSEDRFIGELALACETDKAKKGASLKVILEYLLYTGIVVRDERGLSLGSGATPTAVDPSPTSPAMGSTPAVSAPQPAPARAEPPRSPDMPVMSALPIGPEADGWRVLHTNLFQVRVKEDLDALDELADFLATLRKSVERKLAKQAAAQAAANAPPSSSPIMAT